MTGLTDREDTNTEKGIQDAGGIAQGSYGAGKKAAETGKKAKAAVKEAGGIKALFAKYLGSVPPQVLGIVGGLLLLIVIVMLIFMSTPPNTLFTDSSEDVQNAVNNEISYKINQGYSDKVKTTESNIIYAVKDVGCDGNYSNLKRNVDENGKISYSYTSKYCEININYSPDADTYKNEISGYLVAYNGAIATLDGENEYEEEYTPGSAQVPENPVSNISNDGDITLTDYGKGIINSSEYYSYQSDEFLSKVNEYATDVFTIDGYGSWDYDIHDETRYETKTRTVCYILNEDKDGETTKEQVSCSGVYDFTEEEEYQENYTVQVGNIVAHVSYDMDNFKTDKIDNCVNNLIGTDYIDYKSSVGTSEMEVKTFDEESARVFVDNLIQNYFMGYMMNRGIYEYGEGYSGIIDSNGWNYHQAISSTNSGMAALFWSYSLSIKDILYNLEYKTDNFGGPPIMTHQCTQFAATWFYDVHGFAALRGNGDMMAYNIVKDCGNESSCPVKFELSNTPAPGAVLSVSPNHVAVIDEVKGDGSVVISQGNVKGGNIATAVTYSSVQDYCRKNGKRLVAMAIPVNE